MIDDTKIHAAWARYHGPVNDLFGDEIPQAPPAYVRGYRDGYEAATDEQSTLIGAWQPIATAPASGYMLVYEDGAIRALLRHPEGRWYTPNFPALVATTPGMEHAEYAIVGEEAARFLRPHGLRLALCDGCCENPTHWMPMPAPPVSD